jgi:hypothetical protein
MSQHPPAPLHVTEPEAACQPPSGRPPRGRQPPLEGVPTAADSSHLGGGHIFLVDAFVRHAILDSERERHSLIYAKRMATTEGGSPRGAYCVRTTPIYGSSATQVMAPFTPSSNEERSGSAPSSRRPASGADSLGLAASRIVMTAIWKSCSFPSASVYLR